MKSPLPALRFLALAALAGASITALPAQTVYVSRMWHNHQPTYWPEWNSNGGQTDRVEYAWDSIVLKPGRSYSGSSAQHPENDLASIFGLDDRKNAYQGGPRNSLANLNPSAGFCMSYSGSLIDGVRSLAAAGQLGYGNGWSAGNREARNWRTPAGSRRLDLVGFTYHHSLAPLLPKPVLRKELQIMKQAYWKAWGGDPDLSGQSKGFFPTEMAFSRSIIDVLVEEGYEWSIVASHHLSRTCPTYMDQGDIAANRGIFSSLPNRADLLGPSPTGGWWYGQPNPGNAAWNVAPFAYQLHRAVYVNPETGEESSILLVPSDDVLSYRFGYANEGIGKIQDHIAPFATDPARPVIVMPSTDGDNAWGGGSSSWFEATPQFFNSAGGAGYGQTAVQDFVNQFGAAAQTVHIEDGGWVFPESCYGSANFLKWIEPPLAADPADRYAGTMADLETPGFSLKFWSWAPVITGANWCETAEQILRDEGGDVQAWKIQAPYDWDGTDTGANEVELAWHIYLHGLDSGFNYYGGLGNDDEIKAALATTRAVEKLGAFMTPARLAGDRTAPSVLKPQRYPYNPGTYNFGWFNRNPPEDNSYLKQLPSEFYVWTHAYDVSGVSEVTLKVRLDADGMNSMATNHNETYAGGADVGAWVSIPMSKRELPNTPAELNAAADSGQINYFTTPPVLADYYFAKVDGAQLPGFRGKLIDYYVVATDALGNEHKSEIQHVFVEDDGGGSVVPPPPPPPVSGGAPFVMDGVADHEGYLLSDPGMTIYAALRGDTLYLATWAPGEFGNDHFILVGDAALLSAASPAPWGKAGGVALPEDALFLAAESSNDYIGWFNAGGADGETARSSGGQMEGSIDLAAASGGMPDELFLAALAYGTDDNGSLGSQAPDGDGDGDVDPAELLRIPLEALRDEDANGTYDRLEAGKGFVVTGTDFAPGSVALSWQAFPGRSYQIEFSETLAEGSWDPVPDSEVTAGAGDLELGISIDFDSAPPAGFFRVRLVPPPR